MNLQDAYNFLSSLINNEQVLDRACQEDFKLDRIKELLKRLNNPQNNLKIIHIAGSKAKGSTAAFTAHILKEAGYKVGLYTSPHILDFKERIRILDKVRSIEGNGIFQDAITENELCVVLNKLAPIVEQIQKEGFLGRLTFFEVFTAAAFYFFHQCHVDFAVIETGLGGRLDATNACHSLIACLTPISLEHTHILGNTVEEITREKAAIIKNREQKVVISRQHDSVRSIIVQRCKDFFITPFEVFKEYQYHMVAKDFDQQSIDILAPHFKYENLRLSLIGEHQAENACTAIGIIAQIKKLGFSVSDEAVYRGCETVHWPLRFEILVRRPIVVLDAAHTQESIKMLVSTLYEYFSGKEVILVLGISRDKDIETLCRELAFVASSVVATQAEHPRSHAFTMEQLQKFFPGKHCQITQNTTEALRLASEGASKDAVILVTGSIFLASEARSILGAK